MAVLEEKIDKTIHILMAILCSIVFFAGIVAFLYLIQTNHTYKSTYEFNEGWDIVSPDVSYDNVNLNETTFPLLKKGQILDLYNTVPEYFKDGGTMRMLVYLTSVEVFVGDELVYSYGVEEQKADKMLGSGNHFINIPPGSAGKPIHIHFVMNQDNAFSSISAIVCSSVEDAMVIYADTKIVNAYICFFIVILGIIITNVGIYARVFNAAYTRLFLIGLFATTVGLWAVGSYKLLQFFSYNMTMNTTLEYLMLYLAPIPLGLLIHDMRKGDDKWRTITIKTTTIIFLLFFILSLVLHFTNIVRLPELLTIYHTIGAIGLAVMTIAGFVGLKKISRSDKWFGMGVGILIGFILIDLARYNLQKYVLPNNIILLNSVIPIGCLIFIVLLIISYLMFLYDMVLSEAEKELLTKMAYHDTMTGIFNRAQYDEDCVALIDKSQNFALINLDLNGLKTTNDTFGHEAGDLLIKTFSDILTTCFNDIGRAYRMGGDEFVVIVKAKYFDDIDNALKKMKQMEEAATKEIGITVESAYGLAYANEGETTDPQRIYFIADKRMYEMKEKSKHRRVD